MTARVAVVFSFVLTHLALAAPKPIVGEHAREGVVTVASVRGFQGLFEWVPGTEGMAWGRALGGPWPSNGTIVDLDAVARDLGVTHARAIDRDDVYVLTMLRTVHVADEIWIQGAIPVAGALEAMTDSPARVVATDASLNLALLVAKQPKSGPRFPAGLRLSSEAPVRGQHVIRLEMWGWRLVQSRDVFASRGMPGWYQDPYRLEALPTWWLQWGIGGNQAGGPVIDEVTGRLVGMLSNTQREVLQDGGQARWIGDVHVIEAGYIASFLRAALVGTAPQHGSLVGGGPPAMGVDPTLAALLGLPRQPALYVLADWPASAPVVHSGDVLLRLGGKSIGPGGMTLAEVVFDMKAGATTRLDLRRDGAPLSVEVPVVDLERPTGRDIAWLRFAGAWIQDVPKVLSREGYDLTGPVVAQVDGGSPAEAGALKFGMVVHDVLGSSRSIPVMGAADLAQALRDIVADERFDGEIGLRVTRLSEPGAEPAILLMRTERGTPVEGGTR
jgi:S1-C subfamily serine protease